MSEKLQRPTATIYQFPVRTRASLGDLPRPQVKDRLADSVERTVYGSGWYHEAAILEADLTGRRH